MPDIKVIVPDDLDGTTVRLNQEGKVEAVINQQEIPEKLFVDGSKVLAFDPDGNLYKFGWDSDYFKDGALELIAVSSDLQSDGSTQHTVGITVTNTIKNPIPKATVKLESSSPITDFESMDSDAGSAVWEDSSIVITNLPEFGEVYMQVHVTSSTNTYVSASLEILGDVVPTNNFATLNLRRAERPPATDNIYSKECPLITATFNGFNLTQTTQSSTVDARIETYYNSVFINMVDQEDLNGAVMELDGASSVRVFYTISNTSYSNGFIGVGLVKELGPNKYRSWWFSTYNQDYYEATPSDYTFLDGTLVFNVSAASALIFARTGNSDCKWQRYYIGTFHGDSTLAVNEDRIGIIGLDKKYYHYDIREDQEAKFRSGEFSNTLLPVGKTIGDVTAGNGTIFSNLSDARYFISYNYDWQDYYTYYMTNATLNLSNKLIVEIPRGTKASFKIDRENILPNQQGAVHTEPSGKVEVLASAMPTDSVYTDLVDIVIT